MSWKPLQIQGRILYSVKSGSPIPVSDAQEVGEYITNLGAVTPETMLEDARPEGSRLHTYFEWDDTKAAEQHRLQTCRKIYNHFTFTVVNDTTEEQGTIRAFLNVKTTIEPSKQADEKTKRVYVPTVAAFEKPDYRKQIIGQAKVEIKRWRERYKMYSKFEPLFIAIDKMVE